ncbi:hypothetical protein NM688_g174 [Phlebia brevispora]|uniref:Uncharacterized protein n=1 Tax=Phlebia brevispora TaxID=194682 RepID=A0ACC1TFD0_9APHY|nr:hypothetical protein NM688_g174 [Phlebia brevispora]
MSATIPEAQMASVYEADLMMNYAIIAALAVVCYEFVAAFRNEFELVWQRKWTGATWLFLANRYSIVAAIIIQVAPYNAKMLQRLASIFSYRGVRNPSGDSGHILRSSSLRIIRTCIYRSRCHIFTLSSLGSDATISGQPRRTLLCRRPRTWPIVLLRLPDAAFTSIPVSFPSSCRTSAHLRGPHSTTVASVSCSIAADMIAITITWIKTYCHVRDASAIGIQVGFSATLLEYGTTYFIVLFVVNLLNGLILLVPSLESKNPISPFLSVLPNLILSRFLINLRQVDTPNTSEVARLSRFSAVKFHMPSIPTVIGNLGEPLADGAEEVCEDDGMISEAYGEKSSAISDSGASRVLDIAASSVEEVHPVSSAW